MLEEEPRQNRPQRPSELVRLGTCLAISILYDGRVFDDFPGSCQRCGKRGSVKNGTLERRFARVETPNGGSVGVKVSLQRYLCDGCGRAYTSRGPFYERARYGAPVVDAALLLSRDMPAHSAARVLASLGIRVSTDAILDYERVFADLVNRFARPNGAAEMPRSYGVEVLRVLLGVENANGLVEKLSELGGPGGSSVYNGVYLRRGALRRLLDELGDPREGGRNKGILRMGKAALHALSPHSPGEEANPDPVRISKRFSRMLARALFEAPEEFSG